ncbi:MAG: hypothetical protein ACOH1Y_04600 [Propionicimonas sp.]
MGPRPALVAGLLAGLGIAVPLGAIAVLLVNEGVSRGFRGGWPGALAVGVIDNCIVAALGGAMLLRTVV